MWGEDFGDADFRKKLKTWLEKGQVKHRIDHVTPFSDVKIGSAEQKLGAALAEQLRREKAIMGIFDEGCMGMYNAIIPDDLLFATGVFKERLSQSALYWETTQVSDAEAKEVRAWMEERGMTFVTGPNHETNLTDAQILTQCKMYIAAVRIADDFGCDLIGIQYQQGLKDLLPASDLVEGTLNNTLRPPVKSRDGKRVLYKGEPLPHFNEVDECAGLDGLMTYRIHKAMGQPVENTLHDVRWGDWDQSGTTDEYVWVFLISGSAPPAHFVGGWKGASSERQPAMYFPNGGGTLKGISKPGEIVWSRIFVEDNRLKMDLGTRWRRETAGSRNRTALEGDNSSLAHHARGHVRGLARPVHGPPQGQPHSGCLCQVGGRGRPRTAGQSRHGAGHGNGSRHLRHEARAAHAWV